MYHVFSWHKWRDIALVTLALAVALVAVCEAVAAGRRMQAVENGDREEPRVYLPILMYHSVLKDSSRLGQYVISPAQLESDLAYIRQQGYTTVVMRDVIDYVDNGTPLPEKPIMLTFDDGFYNNYLYAYPLLKQYDMTAVISPVVKWSEFYSDTPQEQDHALYSYLTWAQIREMADSGAVEIQNHTYDMHANKSGGRKGTLMCAGETVESYQQVLRDDLTRAQTLLTQQAGVTPTVFTYPYGAMCDEAAQVIQALGFRGSLSCESRINVITRQSDCLYRLGRYLRPAHVDSYTYLNKIFAAVQAAAG